MQKPWRDTAMTKQNVKALESNRIKSKKKKKRKWGNMASYYKENGDDFCIYER